MPRQDNQGLMKAQQVNVRLAPKTKAAAEAAAEHEGMRLSEWVRALIVSALRSRKAA